MAWTVIGSGSIDAESFLTETLMTEIRDNLEYLFDSAVRCGTFTAPVRLTVARGAQTFLASFDTSSVARMTEVTVTFSSAALDGDPNFIDNNLDIYLAVRESQIDGIDWYTNYIHATPYVEFGSITKDDFLLGCIGLRGDFAGAQVDGFEGLVEWIAVGPVETGE